MEDKKRKKEPSLDDELKAKFQHLYKTRTGKDKSIFGYDVEDCKPCGESSPYQEWLEKHSTSFDGMISEPIEANPDILAEDASPWNNKPILETPELLLIKKEWKRLTKLQKKVLTMVGLQGKSMYTTAIELRMSKSSVQKIIERLRTKFACRTNTNSQTDK